jgi:hypothetical protein
MACTELGHQREALRWPAQIESLRLQEADLYHWPALTLLNFRKEIFIFFFMPTPGGGICICLYAHPWGRNMYLSLCPPLGEEYVFVLISGPKYYEDKVSGAREMFYVLV